MKQITSFSLYLLAAALLLSCNPASVKTARVPTAAKKSVAQADSRAAELVARGAIAELQGDYTSALIAYQEALLYDTTSASLYNAIGETYLVLNKLDGAEQVLKRGLRLDPRNVPARETLAEVYQRLGKAEAAAEEFKTILEIDPENTGALYFLAAYYLAKRAPESAAQMYQRLVDMGKAGMREWWQLGTLYLSLKKYPEARAAFEYSLKDSPEDERGYLAIAAIYAAQNDTTGLIAWYEKALAKDASFNEVRDKLKDAYLATKQMPKAIALIEKSATEDSTNLVLLVQLHGLYLQQGDTLKANTKMAQAIAALQKRWKADSTNVRLLIQISDLQRRKGDSLAADGTISQAIQVLQRKTTDDSTGLENLQMLSGLFFERGDTAQALTTAEEWIKRAPKDYRGYLFLGRLAYDSRRLQLAIDNLTKAVELEASLLEAWSTLGLAQFQLNQNENAQRSFEHAYELAPDNPVVNFFLGVSLSQQRKHQESLPYLTRAIEMSPDNAQWKGTLAATLDELGKHAASDSIYESALKLSPDDATLLNNYSYSLSERGVQLDKALGMVQRALKAEPNNGAFLDTIGWIHYKRREYKLALEYILKAIGVRDTSAEVFEHLGDVYDKLGQTEDARNAWQKALALDANRASVLQKLGLNQKTQVP
ncbi:tetratricopeptide repeat protein [candidate division KSB1 bacterium]|nr:tetratricopeptide repeat protein [candidate division KSB1 bacterium]